MLAAYGPEKAVDGNTSSELSDVSISATGVVEGKNAWFGIDFGAETNRPVEKIVIYTPANLTLLGTMEEFKVMLYDNEKKRACGKNLHHHAFGKIHQHQHMEAELCGQGARTAH